MPGGHGSHKKEHVVTVADGLLSHFARSSSNLGDRSMVRVVALPRGAVPGSQSETASEISQALVLLPLAEPVVLPAGQAVQTVWPVLAEYRPRGHAVLMP